MAILLIAENDSGELSGHTAKALSAATAIGGDVHVLVTGRNVDAVAIQAAQLTGVSKVIAVDAPALADGLAEPLADLIVSIVDGYEVLIAAATTSGKNLMPRVAALLDVMQISDIIEVVNDTTFKRPIYAGNAIATVESRDPIKVITVRTAVFPAADSEGDAAISLINFDGNINLSHFVSTETQESDRPDLSAARTVISGGRAFGSKEKFDALINPVAEKLNAAIGASRAAVDEGYALNDMQVGQTGRIVAPDLYIACGISGAIQHLAGIKDAKVIVAINKDAEAPIFGVADFGLVGDVFELLPELARKL